MDRTPTKERDIVIDIERVVNSSQELSNPDISVDKIGKTLSFTFCDVPIALNESANDDNAKKISELSPDLVKNSRKDNKNKSTSAKKPPRPPRGSFPLDAADQKLIKEISELAMIKRARIERIKALKKMKATKNSTSSTGNLVAMLFTVLFCIVIVFQGCHSSRMPPSNIPVISIHESNEAMRGNIVPIIQEQRNLSTANAPLTATRSLSLIEPVPGLDKNEARKDID